MQEVTRERDARLDAGTGSALGSGGQDSTGYRWTRTPCSYSTGTFPATVRGPERWCLFFSPGWMKKMAGNNRIPANTSFAHWTTIVCPPVDSSRRSRRASPGESSRCARRRATGSGDEPEAIAGERGPALNGCRQEKRLPRVSDKAAANPREAVAAQTLRETRRRSARRRPTPSAEDEQTTADQQGHRRPTNQKGFFLLPRQSRHVFSSTSWSRHAEHEVRNQGRSTVRTPGPPSPCSANHSSPHRPPSSSMRR